MWHFLQEFPKEGYIKGKFSRLGISENIFTFLLTLIEDLAGCVLSSLRIGGMAPLPFSVFSIKDSEVTPIFFFSFLCDVFLSSGRF